MNTANRIQLRGGATHYSSVVTCMFICRFMYVMSASKSCSPVDEMVRKLTIKGNAQVKDITDTRFFFFCPCTWNSVNEKSPTRESEGCVFRRIACTCLIMMQNTTFLKFSRFLFGRGAIVCTVYTWYHRQKNWRGLCPLTSYMYLPTWVLRTFVRRQGPKSDMNSSTPC